MNPAGEHIYVKTARQKENLAKTEWALQKAASKKWINFFKITYDHEQMRINDTREAFFMEIGFRLPFAAPNTDLSRARLDWLDQKTERMSLQHDLDGTQVLLFEKLQGLFRQYRLLKEDQEAGSAESALSVYRQIAGVDPLVLLSIRERMHALDRDMENLRHEIRVCYLDLLDATGALSLPPVQNYLTEEIAPILNSSSG